MGDLLPFRKRPRTWTRPEDYGHVLPASQWRGELARPNILIRFWRAVRWWLALIALAAAWVFWRNAIAFDPPAFLEGQPIAVNAAFTRCGAGRGPPQTARLCVVDGDTLKIAQRTIRIVGIDAPEVRAQCPAEALGAERATAVLQRWVNAAPFELVPRLDSPTDKYGRELMTARRTVRGRTETAAEVMIEAGVARAYRGEARAGWC
jgi:endonuclease YncB( thermonuclease family)